MDKIWRRECRNKSTYLDARSVGFLGLDTISQHPDFLRGVKSSLPHPRKSAPSVGESDSHFQTRVPSFGRSGIGDFFQGPIEREGVSSSCFCSPHSVPQTARVGDCVVPAHHGRGRSLRSTFPALHSSHGACNTRLFSSSKSREMYVSAQIEMVSSGKLFILVVMSKQWRRLRSSWRTSVYCLGL